MDKIYEYTIEQDRITKRAFDYSVESVGLGLSEKIYYTLYDENGDVYMRDIDYHFRSDRNQGGKHHYFFEDNDDKNLKTLCDRIEKMILESPDQQLKLENKREDSIKFPHR